MPNCRCTNDQITEPDPKRLMVNRTYIFNFRFTFLRRKKPFFIVFSIHCTKIREDIKSGVSVDNLTEGCVVVFERAIITGFNLFWKKETYTMQNVNWAL